MGEFKKYASIENHYRDDFIQKALSIYPELNTIPYSITEKIHGANICIIFKDGNYQLASRNQLLGEDNFMGVREVIKREEYQTLLNKILERHKKISEVYPENIIHLYGELFGKGIQKGVDYGEEKRLLFFDAAINGEYLTQYGFCDFIDEDLRVPTVGIVSCLEDALNFNTEFDSFLSDKEDNLCEGIVIKPAGRVYYIGDDIFYIKKKNEAFKEKQKTSKVKKETVDFPEEVQNFHNEFMSYITENRMNNIFSKYGRIDSPSKIGEYIRYMLEDAKTEFVKDMKYVEGNYNKECNRYIFNVGQSIVMMLQRELGMRKD